MSTITVTLSEPAAEKLRQLVETEKRSEAEIITEALQSYVPQGKKLPTGVGKHRSGQPDLAQKTRQILRQDAAEGKWP